MQRKTSAPRPERVKCKNKLCGNDIMVQGHGPIPMYCSNACNQQALRYAKGQVGIWVLVPERPINAKETKAFPINVWDEGKGRYVTMWRTRHPEDRTEGVPFSRTGTGLADDWHNADGGHEAYEHDHKEVTSSYADLYYEKGDGPAEAGESRYSAVTDRPRRRGKRQVGDVTRELGMNLGYRRSRIPTMKQSKGRTR